MARCRLPWNSSKADDFLVSAGLIPSFEEFSRECSKKLEEILKRRNPGIKYHVTSQQNGSTAETLCPFSVQTEQFERSNEEELECEQDCTAEVPPSHPDDDSDADLNSSYEGIRRKLELAEHLMQLLYQSSPNSSQELPDDLDCDLDSSAEIFDSDDPEAMETTNEEVPSSESEYEEDSTAEVPPSYPDDDSDAGLNPSYEGIRRKLELAEHLMQLLCQSSPNSSQELLDDLDSTDEIFDSDDPEEMEITNEEVPSSEPEYEEDSTAEVLPSFPVDDSDADSNPSYEGIRRKLELAEHLMQLLYQSSPNSPQELQDDLDSTAEIFD